MALVSMDLVKQLREKTQVSLMDCKKALEEAQGNMDQALDILRKRGAAVAAKRSGNQTNEGVIVAQVLNDHKTGALVEIACETDFSANTDMMRTFATAVVSHVAQRSANNNDVTSLMKEQSVTHPTLNLQQLLEDLIARISESIKVTRFVRFSSSNNGFVHAYIHPGSHLGVLIELATQGSASSEHLTQLAKDVCMQIAVTNPLGLTPADLDPAVVAKEREIFLAQMATSGKPAAMLEKIVDGKVTKFYQDVCLLNQKFIKNDKISIQDYLNEFARSNDTKVTIVRFARFSIGK